MGERDQARGRASAEGGPEGGPGKRARDRVSESFNRVRGVLSAFKDAVEETISEARERGDLTVDRARDSMKGAVGRAREVTSEARGRFDFVSQAEFSGLVRRVRALEDRLGRSADADRRQSPEATEES